MIPTLMPITLNGLLNSLLRSPSSFPPFTQGLVLGCLSPGCLANISRHLYAPSIRYTSERIPRHTTRMTSRRSTSIGAGLPAPHLCLPRHRITESTPILKEINPVPSDCMQSPEYLFELPLSPSDDASVQVPAFESNSRPITLLLYEYEHHFWYKSHTNIPNSSTASQ